MWLARRKSQLSPLETKAGRATAEEVRQALRRTQSLNGSAVSTLLLRLESKGYLEHDVEGRTYVYRPRVESQRVAAEAVRGIIERFCEGSVENLLLGMVDDRILTPEKLEELARKIAAAQAAGNLNLRAIRSQLTARLSDDGVTWPSSKVIRLGQAGYSNAGVLDDGTLLRLYEADDYSKIVCPRFNATWLRSSAEP